MAQERSTALDIIRNIAIICVISVHFLLNTKFYETTFYSTSWIYIFTLRSFFIIGVPLFLLLTGYLLSSKECLNSKYYSKLKYIMGLYIIISIITAIGMTFILNKNFNITQFITDLINFKYIGYGWYVEMYIGLFLLIPFLNILWQGLKNKKEQKYLLCTLTFLTILPSCFKEIAFFTNYWVILSPITLYFFGAFLKKYHILKSVKLNIILIIIAILAFGSLNFGLSYQEKFYIEPLTDSLGIESVIVSILVFDLIIKFQYKKINTHIKNIITQVSKLSYGIYLASYIVDKIIYKKFDLLIAGNTLEKSKYYILIVGIVLLLSLLISKLANILYKSIDYKQKN